MQNRKEKLILVTSENFNKLMEFKDIKVNQVFLWLLFNANDETERIGNDIVGIGMIETKNSVIASGCNITIDNVRKALAKLEKSGHIRRYRRSFCQLIEIPEYESYLVKQQEQ